MNSRGAMSTTVEVLGLGNSLVDILGYADDDYLSAQDMLKGAMNLIDEDRAEALYAARVDPRVISGGSAANTIVGVASFGVPAAYIGKVKRDPLGAAFADDIRSTGVKFATAPAEHGPSTGRCFIPVYCNDDEPDMSELVLIPGARYLIIPGSVGQPRDHDRRAAFAIYDDQQMTVQFRRVPYDFRQAQMRIMRAGLPDQLAMRLSYGR